VRGASYARRRTRCFLRPAAYEFRFTPGGVRVPFYARRRAPDDGESSQTLVIPGAIRVPGRPRSDPFYAWTSGAPRSRDREDGGPLPEAARSVLRLDLGGGVRGASRARTSGAPRSLRKRPPGGGGVPVTRVPSVTGFRSGSPRPPGTRVRSVPFRLAPEPRSHANKGPRGFPRREFRRSVARVPRPPGTRVRSVPPVLPGRGFGQFRTWFRRFLGVWRAIRTSLPGSPVSWASRRIVRRGALTSCPDGALSLGPARIV
jgi:hypothetical protein